MNKFAIKLAVLCATAFLMYFLDLAPQSSQSTVMVQFVAEAHAVLGVRRRAARRGVAVGYAAGESNAHAEDAAAASSAQAAPAPAAAAPATAPVYGTLPEGTIEPALPDGCTTQSADNVQYYHCGENYFRAVFQGNSLVYVTAAPPKS